MKDKEKLLSFETPLKFIFSHSALTEGWDNPNVFQICALREMGTERERRQTIGRGLRLCVNQNGERLRGFEVNTLTVIATESYEQFAENLQKEIEEDTGHPLRHRREAPVRGDRRRRRRTASRQPLGVEQSKVLWEHLQDAGLRRRQGQGAGRAARRRSRTARSCIPEAFAGAASTDIAQVLRKLAGKLEIKNADERRQVRPRQAVLHSDEFKALWDRIKHKTTYRVQFDNEKLIEDCTKALTDAPPIAKTRLQWRKADIAIGKAGVEATETSVAPRSCPRRGATSSCPTSSPTSRTRRSSPAARSSES